MAFRELPVYLSLLYPSMKFTISLLLCAALAFSCQNSMEGDQKTIEHKPSMRFGDTVFEFPEFSFPVEDHTAHWEMLKDVISEAREVNGSNLQALKNRSERLREYSDSLFKRKPDLWDSPSIRSRLMVLKTRTEMLYQNAHQDILDSANLQKSVVEMNVAVKNLIIQMNEKFQKDRIDAQRSENEQMELRSQQRFSDSIMELERQDARDREM